jgi:hypothetical protein
MEFGESGCLEENAHTNVGGFDGFDNRTILDGSESIIACAESYGCHDVEGEVVTWFVIEN